MGPRLRHHLRKTKRAVFALLMLLGCARTPAGSHVPHQWGVKIIYASNDRGADDPRLRTLSKQLSSLKFTNYQLRDEATFSLEPGATGQMELPNHGWLRLKPQGDAPDGRLRLDIAMEPLQFKTTVAVATGATVAVGGPPFAEGTLILAVTLL